MITLHNKKGGISGQVLKDLYGEDIKLLDSNINQTNGTQWQTLIKFRRTDVSFPAQYGFALLLHSAFEKDSPFAISLSEDEARAKLKSWGHSTTEIEKLINAKMEVE